jgi:hypothetical protein
MVRTIKAIEQVGSLDAVWLFPKYLSRCRDGVDHTKTDAAARFEFIVFKPLWVTNHSTDGVHKSTNGHTFNLEEFIGEMVRQPKDIMIDNWAARLEMVTNIARNDGRCVRNMQHDATGVCLIES